MASLAAVPVAVLASLLLLLLLLAVLLLLLLLLLLPSAGARRRRRRPSPAAPRGPEREAEAGRGASAAPGQAMEGTAMEGAAGPLASPVEIRVAAAPEAEGEGLRGEPEEEEGEEDEEEEEGRRGRPRPIPLGSGSCSEDDSSGRGDGARRDGAKSSGGENEECSHQWKPPDHDLIVKLVAQIEYYFSDENLEKDTFLLKHVRRNKMGYVSVKLLTSFKKVKHLTRDWRTTAYALKYSDVLELNEDSRKVRRNTPVPVFPSENLPSKMLLVYDLCPMSALRPLDGEQENGCLQEKVMERLLKSFVKFGTISSVRVLKPGRDLPPDLKRFSSRYAQVGTEECAIVEFEEVEAAIRAHESMCMADQGQDMKVVLMGMKPPKKKVPKDESSGKGLAKVRSVNKRVEELQYVGDESSANSSSEPESNPTSPMSGRRSSPSNQLSPSTYSNHHLSPNISPRSSPWNSPSSLRKVSRMSPLAEDGRWNRSNSPEAPGRCADYSSDSSLTPSGSPWVQRRRQQQQQVQIREKSPVGSPAQSPKMQGALGIPVGVLRFPRGPDGTKGFHNGRGKNQALQE